VQTLNYLFLSGRGAKCYKKDEGFMCDLPDTWGGALVTRTVPVALAPQQEGEPAAVIWSDRTSSQTTDPNVPGSRRSTSLQDAGETSSPTVMPTVTIQQKELELGQPLRLTFVLLDEYFSLVLGDSFSQILVQSICTEEGATSYVGRKVEAAVAAALNNSFTGDIDVVSPLLFPVQSGAALAEELYFNGPCANMTLVVKCVGSEVDTLNLCNNMPPMYTERFAVVLPEGVTLPPPSPPPPPLQYTIKLRTTEPQPNPADAQRVFSDFARTITSGDFNSELGGVLRSSVQQIDRVVLNAICGIPTGRVPREPIESDYTEAGSSDGGICIEHASTERRRSRLLQETSLDVLSLFTVVFSARAAGISPNSLSDAVDAAIREDIRRGSQVGAFSQITPGNLEMSSVFTAAVPPTPVPTPVPSPTPAPPGGPTASPQVPPSTTSGGSPAVATPPPPQAPEEPILVVSGASSPLAQLARVIVAIAAVLLVY